jgi:hypothetical protein
MSMWNPDPVSRLLRSAAEVFASEGSAQRPAVESIRLTQLTLDRLLVALGRPPEESARRWMSRNRASLRSNRMPATIRSGLTFEVAERARLNGDPGFGGRLYRVLLRSETPFHRGLGMLGLAELNREFGRHGNWAQRALEIGRRYSLGWLHAEAALSLWLAGELSDSAAVEEIESSGAELPRHPDQDPPSCWLIASVDVRRPLLAVV